MTTELAMYEALLRRSIERGVPNQAVADIFDLPLDTVRELSRECKVTRFNTADQEEYVENLQWETLQRTEQVIRTGSPDQIARIATTVFGRQIQAAGRRPSSSTEEAREALMEAFRGVRESPPVAARAGRFVMGNTDVDRRAHRDEDDED